MGVQGLLPFLEKATKPCHISEFRGHVVAIDTYCWLHKGANSCAFELASGNNTNLLVQYCLRYIKLLQSFDIKPILVFDGKNLPAKAETESKRRESRNRAKQRASELLKLGKTEEARNYLRQCVNITPEMAVDVIKECQKLQIDCIVAPYESDAQLAFLNRKGIADIIITEDSDLLLFGCTRVMYKLDLRGCGYIVEADKIPSTLKLRPDKYTFEKFLHMCILSGCDYVNSLQGIGLKKAEKFIILTEEQNPLLFLDKVPRYLNMRHLQITDKYKEDFMLADATFKHQIVFDPFKRQLVPLTDWKVFNTKQEYCRNAGEIFDNEIAYQVALGNLHPTNHKKLNNWSPTKNKLALNSIWSGSPRKSVPRKIQQTLLVKNTKQDKEINENYDKLEIEADKKIEQELSSYFMKLESNTKISDSEEEPIEEKEDEVSPVLKKNPFLKKLSKFQMTRSKSDIIVKSRYFCSQSEIEMIEAKGGTEKIDDEIIEVDNICAESKPVDFSESPIQAPSDFKVSENFTEKHTELDTIEVEDISRSQPCSSGALVNSSNTKRKRPGTCKSLGLKRTKSEGQPTLHNFFRKL
ncbi:exonuclease 1 isoform X1 [Diorhabda carinulata]|uniref:exonuclease 1 isoform X1 n=2 Tax=Diorhabda carinulata TaxID=1163345 RepID=UPI0025A2EC1A|nr:exonuclease 1 isoform X1 [Diorhabda carinulata]